MARDTESMMALALKDIAKELHELNRKLDRMSQASIFGRSSTVFDVITELPYSMTHDLDVDIINSQEKQSL